MIGCFDTKAEDFQYLHSCLLDLGVKVISINTGVRGTSDAFQINHEAAELATLAGSSIEVLRESDDRNLVVQKMGEGAATLITQLMIKQKIDGAIGMGGGGGTYIALAAMQALPFGLPKLCLSTVATKDLSRQVGTKDITLMPSVVDVAGLNKISRVKIAQAAGAICGMANTNVDVDQNAKGTIAISMFGNTTKCVEECTRLLTERGYEVLAFHAVGVGGITMEALIEEGVFDGVLDLTITELADDLCDGICSAGPDRLTAACIAGIPQVVAPGCLDMVNYGHIDTVPAQYKDRQLYSWAPDVTLMRTNEEENVILAKSIAKKLNASQGQTAVLIPQKGISIVSSEGGVFHNPKVDQLLFDTLKDQLNDHIPIHEFNGNINDPRFAALAVNTLLALL